ACRPVLIKNTPSGRKTIAGLTLWAIDERPFRAEERSFPFTRKWSLTERALRRPALRAAVNADHLPADETSFFRCQKGDHGSDLVRPAVPQQRPLLHALLLLDIVAHEDAAGH